MLFVLGGNGTHAGANAIHDEVVKLVTFVLRWGVCYYFGLCKIANTRKPKVN